ncbi:MAG: tRNA preQ1(34) S-adenosylmethionine ribosyltransferase-isomerase QueA [Candidatus Gastranaerophilales bacterium]|nr:tRNA preQ1(34) S-adenosylmethionine ribosyltransferase-isomerase QueA [Candidatus Gastranaerophilales bacterium]
MTYKLSDFDYNLPSELIAQYPVKNRTNCRMMHLLRDKSEVLDEHFYDILNYLSCDDVLVLNDTKVYPARLKAKRASGAEVEIFLLNPLGDNYWLCLTKNFKRVKIGETLEIAPEFSAELIEKKEAKPDEIPEYIVKLSYKGDIYETLNKYGSIPLPPYITREANKDDDSDYQTVFARHIGSVACPTAGLHFDTDLLEKITKKGVKIAYVTLNVGLGTFMPVKCENIEDHTMHYESFSISKETADLINNKKGSVIAVGTTVLRCLEATYQKYNKIIETADKTNIFIYPPYKIKSIDKLITNFHLPKSTLIMLVSAFAGKDFIFSAYKQAIENKYRFFSYGDCMFIE